MFGSHQDTAKLLFYSLRNDKVNALSWDGVLANIVISNKTVSTIGGDIAVYQMLNGTKNRD